MELTIDGNLLLKYIVCTEIVLWMTFILKEIEFGGMERGVRKRAWSTARYTVTNSFSLVRCSLNDLINNWIHIALRVTNDVCIDRVTNIKSNCLAAWDAKYNRTFLINYLPQALLPNVITCNSVTGEASSCPHSHFIGRSIRFIYRCHTI